jgi:hypothetical protein
MLWNHESGTPSESRIDLGIVARPADDRAGRASWCDLAAHAEQQALHFARIELLRALADERPAGDELRGCN